MSRLLLVIVFLLTGCSGLAPYFQRPASPIPDAWPKGAAYSTIASVTVHADGQDFVADPKLQQLIALALANNRDLRVAALAIEKAQSLYQIERAALFPHINANAGYNAALTPGNLTSANMNAAGKNRYSHVYSAGLGFSAYELDFFGRVHDLKDMVLEQYLSTEEAHRSMQISLVAEMAMAYLKLSADQGHLLLAEDTLKTQQSAHEMVKRRFEAGVAAQLALSQAEIAVDAAQNDVARYTGMVAQDVNALTLLAGAPLPEDLLPAASVANLQAVRDIPAGLPSDLLQNRPDILGAEHQLRAANANIGIARAAFFPSITLTSSIGAISNQLSGLFNSNSRTWLFAPQLNLPIFDWGANQANLKGAQANGKIYLAQYEKTIQVAFREVADALADHGTLGAQLAAQQSMVAAAELSLKLSDARFQNGVDSYLAVLDAQRSLYAAQHNLISLKLAQQTNRVTLYKALGGGAAPVGSADQTSAGN